MGVNWVGVRAGYQSAMEARERKEDREYRDRQEARLEEQFQDSKIANRLKAISDYSTFRGGREGGKGGLSNDIDKVNLLKSINSFLPKDSEIVIKLSHADTKTLNQALEIINKGREDAKKRGQTFTPEIAENLFEEVYQTTVVKESTFDPIKFAEEMNISLEEDYLPGVTWAEYLQQYTEPKSTTATQIIPKVQLEPLDPSGRNFYRNLYKGKLSDALADIKNDLDTRISNEIPVDQAYLKSVDEAIGAIKNTDSFGPATRLIGPEIAISIVEQDPRVRPYINDFISNAAFTFTDDAFGQELVARALRVGVLGVGDKIMVGTERIEITEEMLSAAKGG